MSLFIPNPPHFKVPVFEGPLDLLLHLIRENRIDIYDIPIADITRQYLDYLAMWEALDLAVAGEYLVMAATLLEIKSRMLLPQAPPEETTEDELEDPRAELVQRLLEYQRYQGSIETLRGWEEYRRKLYFRGALENPDDYLLPLPEGALNIGVLVNALRQMLADQGVEESVTAVVPKRRANLRMKMAEVLRKVKAHPKGLPFDDLFETPCYRYDIVLSFLALLELLRNAHIRFKQKNPTEPIMLYSVEEAP